MRNKAIYVTALSGFFVLMTVLSGNLFILFGLLSFLAAGFLEQRTRRTPALRLVSIAWICSAFMFALSWFFFVYLYREGDILLFGYLGDDYRYLSAMEERLLGVETSEWRINIYRWFPNFIGFLYSVGGVQFVFFTSWLFFFVSATLFSWQMYRTSGNRAYLQALIYLAFFPDIYLWSTALYKEIWVGAGALLLLSAIARPALGVAGFSSLVIFRMVYLLPLLAALFLGARRQVNGWTFLGVILVLSVVAGGAWFFFQEDLNQYFGIFFRAERLDVIASKIGFSPGVLWLLFLPLLLAISPVIALATPPSVYLDIAGTYDTLWWMTAASGTFMAFMLPWLFSYRKRDTLFYSLILLSAYLVVGFLFLTNRHRFLISLLAVYMGGVSLASSSRVRRLGYIGAFAVFGLQAVILKLRDQL